MGWVFLSLDSFCLFVLISAFLYLLDGSSSTMLLFILPRVCVCSFASVVSDSLQPHRPQSTRILCPWDFPGKNTGVGNHFLLKGISPTQGLNPCLPHLLHCRLMLCLLNHQGSPLTRRVLFYTFHLLCKNEVELPISPPSHHLAPHYLPFSVSLGGLNVVSQLCLCTASVSHICFCVSYRKRMGEPQLDQSQCPAFIWVELTTV